MLNYIHRCFTCSIVFRNFIQTELQEVFGTGFTIPNTHVQSVSAIWPYLMLIGVKRQRNRVQALLVLVLHLFSL